MTLTSLKLACKKGNAFTSRLKLWGKMASLRFSLRFLACRTKGAGNLHLKRLLEACSLLLLLTTPVWGSPRTTGEAEVRQFEIRYHDVRSRLEILRTLPALKGRLKNRPSLLEKITRKLSTVNEEQARLIISLCDRVTEGGQTAGADAAFLLMTVLLILS